MSIHPCFVHKTDRRLDRRTIGSVCLDIFVHEQHPSGKLERDDPDESCSQVLALNAGNNPFTTGRLLDNGQIGGPAIPAPWNSGNFPAADIPYRHLIRDFRATPS